MGGRQSRLSLTKEFTMIVCRPLYDNAEDPLNGRTDAAIRIVDRFDETAEIKNVPAPAGGWTHNAVESESYTQVADVDRPWSAFLGDEWIGCSDHDL
jgi:hypothetical protein